MATQITTINMLILDPSSNNAEQTINILRNNGHVVRATQILTESDLKEALERQSWDLFIVRDQQNNLTAEKCLKIVQHFGSDIPFIMTTENYSIERTVEAMLLGMQDVIPDDNEEYFRLVIDRELSSINDKRSRKLADSALQETDKRNELLLDSSRDAIAYVIDGMHIYVNHAYLELFGYKEPDDLDCMPILDLIDSNYHDIFKKYIKDHSKGETQDDLSFVGLNASGSTFEAYLSMTDSEYDGESCTQLYIKTAEATDEELEQKLKELTATDRLTGLFNQHHFMDCVSEAINNASDNNQLAVVFYMELDDFAQIQEKQGITNTDLFLKEVGLWLTEQLPSEGVLARTGDSTFNFLATTDNKDQAQEIADDLCKKFDAHLFEVNSITITDSFSIGISLVSESSTNVEKVISDAHFAVSRVQSKGGNNYRLHDSSLDSLDNRSDAQTEMEIQDARDNGLIHVMYEPIVKLHGSVERMYHARLSVQDKDGTYSGVSEVYDIGMKTTTASKLDTWLMEYAFPEFSKHLNNSEQNKNCILKIQLTAASLLDDKLIPTIIKLMSENNLPSSSIIFEFKEEDAVIYLKRAIEIINSLGQQGLLTALSGFGSTFNSESIVNSINTEGFDWISVDSALMNNFIGTPEAQEKVQKLLTFADANDLATIAPTISEPGTLATIWPMNVGHIHGEYIASEDKEMLFDFSEVTF